MPPAPTSSRERMNLLRCPRSEEEAIAYLQVKGLIPLKHLCPRGHNMRLYLGKQNRWKCTKENCTNSSYSIRSGTWFACSKLPFVDIIRFIYCWSEELTSVKFCEKELNLSKTTVVDWNKYMREVVAKEILSQPKKKIGGQNLIVEIEGLLCTREVNEKGNHSLEERWIFGGVCRSSGECFLAETEVREDGAILAALRENVEVGSILYSDSWKGYRSQEVEKAGFKHLLEKEGKNLVVTKAMSEMQVTVDSTKGSTRWRNKRHRGAVNQHLESYFAEFLWRNKHASDDLFDSALEAIKNFGVQGSGNPADILSGDKT